MLAEAVKEIGGKPLEVRDYYPSPIRQSVVKITTDEINSLLGTKYSTDLIIKTLKMLGLVLKSKAMP